MPNTDPPPRVKRATKGTAQAATTRKTKPKPTEGVAPETALPTGKKATDVEPEAPTNPTTETVDATTPANDGTAARTTQTAPAVTVDPFSYNESTLTLSLSFLPLVQGAAGRTVIVSVHSKNGTGKAVLPEFMAPMQEGDFQFPKPVLALLERYRSVTLPKRRTEAKAKAAALAAKRPVTHKRGKDLRPEHVTAGTTKRVPSPGVATQFKLNFTQK